MAPSDRRARAAVAEATALNASRLRDRATPAAAAGGAGPGSGDPLIGDLRRAGLLQLLVLHLVSERPSYGNGLIESVSQLTAGAVAVNPNTIYPLLRALEARGLVSGAWEHPERRSRRFYEITAEGVAECDRLRVELEPRLAMIAKGLARIRRELAVGTVPAVPASRS